MKFKRLTEAERNRLGVSKASKRRVNADVKRVTKATKLYTDRQVATVKLKERIGRAVSKEQFTKAVKSGEASYASPTTVLQQKHIQHSRAVLKAVPQMSVRDLILANRWNDVGFDGLTPDEQSRFRSLFKRYEADAVRQAFGSNPRDVGSFSVAA